jgi:tRNA splicing endonuclease
VPGVKCLAVEDEKGVVFHLRVENVMRVYAQFPPEQEIDHDRLHKALHESFLFVASGAKRMGYREMIFDSVSQNIDRVF